MGWLSCLTAPHTLALETRSMGQTAEYRGLCVDMVATKPGQVMVTTSHDAEKWNHLLTTAWNRAPGESAEKLRFKPSAGRGQVFAQVATTDERLAYARIHKGATAPDPTWAMPLGLRATLHIPMDTAGPIDTWFPLLAGKISGLGGPALSKATGQEEMQIHTWRALTNQAEEWTGMVVIQCGTADEIRVLHRLLQGKAIYVNGHSTTARVDAPAVDLAF